MAINRRRSTKKAAAAAAPAADPPAEDAEASASAALSKKGSKASAAAAAAAAGDDDDEGDGSCPACAEAPAPTADGPEESWIQCEACKVWFHWRCVRPAGAEDMAAIDKWFCAGCLAADPKRAVTVRPPARKSARQRKAQDYAGLHAGADGAPGPASGSRWAALMRDKPLARDAFRRMDGAALTREWLDADPDALREPIVVERPDGLGMDMPGPEFTVQDVADAVGEDTPVEVIDVATQSNCPGWTVGKWAAYFGTPADARDKVRNVISLEVSQTALAERVHPPRLVRELDWVERFWPAAKRGRGHQYPKVQLYCLMGVADAWTDWHVDFAGSSVYYHIVSGSKVFYFIRPTPANLAAYERWSSSEMQTSVWLGDMVDEVVRVELVTGNTMIIPTGWIHAVGTPKDTLVFGGNFLHSYNIGTQLKVCGIENRTNVPKKFRFPHFNKLCWYAAEKYVRDLKAKEEFPTRVLESLDALAGYLVGEARTLERGSEPAKRAAREAVPGDRVKDAPALARELRWRVRLAAGNGSDDEGGHARRKKAPAAAAVPVAKEESGTAGKRKREESGTPALFRHFRPKAWALMHSEPGAPETLVVRAPRPDTDTDDKLASWGDWTEGTEGEDADVRREKHVLTRVRRTPGGGLERQRIERTIERWTWKGDAPMDGGEPKVEDAEVEVDVETDGAMKMDTDT